MKIAIVRKKYTFHGGAESFSQELIRNLAAAGHDVHIFASQWDGLPGADNISLHKVFTLGFNSTLRDLAFAVGARAALRGGEFDIIQSHDKTIYQDIYRAGDGCHVEWLRQRWKRAGLGGRLSILFNPYHRMILALEREILNGHRFRKIIAISSMVKTNILNNYCVREEDIEVIYNGVDLIRFHPDNRAAHRERIRAEHSIGRDDTVALFVGSGFERKGVRYLLKALELVEEPLTVMIAGKGPEMPVRDRRGNKRVLFLGPIKDIQEYYAAADMFVFPALYEPFGNVHLEAMASGLPVITTALAGGAELIEEGVEGFVVPAPEDTDLIAEGIAVMMDGETRRRMSAAARRKAEGFPFQRHMDETLRLYNKVLEEKAAGGR